MLVKEPIFVMPAPHRVRDKLRRASSIWSFVAITWIPAGVHPREGGDGNDKGYDSSPWRAQCILVYLGNSWIYPNGMVEGCQNLPGLFQLVRNDSPQFFLVYFPHMGLRELIYELQAFGQFKFGNFPLVDQEIIELF
jgi:hypothetical protein